MFPRSAHVAQPWAKANDQIIFGTVSDDRDARIAVVALVGFKILPRLRNPAHKYCACASRLWVIRAPPWHRPVAVLGQVQFFILHLVASAKHRRCDPQG